MYRSLVMATVLVALSHSKSTIDDTRQLFWNTITRWDVQITSQRDYKQRYKRLVEIKRTVDETTSGVLLDSLNRFAVNNDQEQAAMMALAHQASNLTQIASNSRPSFNLKPATIENETLPREYEYWEKELGMSNPQDQQSCGACWSFPSSAALEAVYRKLTGEFVVFSKQYFIDCTFSYSGCSGGTASDGYEVTSDRQYLMSEDDWPTTASYKPCIFKKQIESGEKNAMRKTWLQDWFPLGRGESGMLKGLMSSPVAFGSYISENYFAYSSGLYDDALCATEALGHTQLLVGYTKDYLRVRGSYGVWWGDNGYINYKRGSPNLESCNFYSNAFAITMIHRRDMEYEFCNEAKLATRSDCQKSCLDMNKKGESGWNLATIPTRKHNDEVVNMVNARYPGVKSDDKFNLIWIGLSDPSQSDTYKWSDGYTQVGYFNHTRRRESGKFGLLNKNTGDWRMKNSMTFQARGLCSRARTCWDISSAINRGSVTFSTTDVGNLVEGTTAKVTCEKKCKVKGASKLTCIGGQWNGNDSMPYCKCKKKKKKKDKKLGRFENDNGEYFI